MAEIYGRKDGLCGGYGGSMHLVDPSRGFLGTSGIVGQGIPQATGAAWAAQIRKQGQIVLCFFGDGASKQGAFHESLNLASLWKLPIVLRDGEQQLQRGDALRAGGRQRRRRRAAVGQGQGVQHARGDGRRRRPRRGVRDRRGGGGSRPRGRRTDAGRVEGLPAVSAHGNIIAPPGVPLHYPEHEAITVFGNREEYEAALRGDPVPRFRARLIEQGALSAERADEIAAAGPRRDGRGGAVRARQPVSRGRSRRPHRLRLRLGDNHGTRDPLHRGGQGGASTSRWRATTRSLFYGQDVAPSDEDPLVQAFGRDRVRVSPISETAEIGMAVGAGAGRLSAGRGAADGRVHARGDEPGRQRGPAPPLHERRPGQGSGRAQGRLRVHRRLGRPAHRLDLRHVHGRPRAEGRAARRRRPTPRA